MHCRRGWLLHGYAKIDVAAWREQSVSFGVDHDALVKRTFMQRRQFVFGGNGPCGADSCFGLMVANLARDSHILPHTVITAISVLLSFPVMLLAGQLAVERYNEFWNDRDGADKFCRRRLFCDPFVKGESSVIEVRDISKIYSSVTVLDGVSFRIADRSITSFVGPNGAGKTTLLGIISRLIKPDGGEVLLDEKSISEYGGSDLAKRISIPKQSNFVNMRLTVRELIGFGRFPHSGGRLTGEDKDMVERAVEYLDLAEMAEKDINELSGGQRQRAFIGMIVAQDTDHILLDEPLNSLDMRHSVEMMRILRRLTDELKKTVVLVLHDINFAARYSDRMVALKNGKVAAGRWTRLLRGRSGAVLMFR